MIDNIVKKEELHSAALTDVRFLTKEGMEAFLQEGIDESKVLAQAEEQEKAAKAQGPKPAKEEQPTE